MCSNYRPVTSEDRLLTFFGVERKLGETVAPEVWPLGLAPFIRLSDDGSGSHVAELGQFGMMPPHAAEVAYGRKTYNARSETVRQLYTYKAAWARGQRCIIPAEAIYEPCWETGNPVRWRIQQPGATPIGVAGVYRRSKTTKGDELWSFAMLTVNADGHPVFKRMHRPEDEKRMVVILSPDEYGDWLTCPRDQAPKYFRQWPGDLEAYAAPLPPRVRSPKKSDRELF